MNSNGNNPGPTSPAGVAEMPLFQLPALRTFRVKYGDVETDKIVTTTVQAHGITHEDSGALSFIEATLENGQVVPRIRRAFREWIEFEEIVVSAPSMILH